MLNCAKCGDRKEYKLRLVLRTTITVKHPKGDYKAHPVKDSPVNVRCGADRFGRWCGVKGQPIKARPWCPRRKAIAHA